MQLKWKTSAPAPSTGLTPEEKHILDLTADVWNEYTKLEEAHPSEFDELQLLIHQIQYLVARRVAKRVDPDIWG